MSKLASLPQLPVVTPPAATMRLLLVGNPNAGKTSLFNRLSGLRAHTSNFAGTTVEHRAAEVTLGARTLELLDLPGLYSLDAATSDEHVASDAILGKLPGTSTSDAMLLVLDGTNLERNLFLASQVLELGRPTVVALTMADIAARHSLVVDAATLSQKLGAPVVSVSARTGEGIAELVTAIDQAFTAAIPARTPTTKCACSNCSGCPYSARFDWAEQVSRSAIHGPLETIGATTEWLDDYATHPIAGLAVFAAVMFAMFMAIFYLAQFPMTLLDTLVANTGEWVGSWLPAGDLRSLVVDGLIGGAGGMLVFLPQICCLFFLLALLDDSGYLSRAALVMDRLMARVGLPGKAFVPMLSAHACAIPAIMSTRVIEDRRDRLVTMLVIPLLGCSARVPVYAMVMALLFPHDPLMAAMLFTGAYALGIVAALGLAWLLKRTLLPGESRPLVIELPNYRVPSLRNALLLTLDRAGVFVKNAGTTILAISLVLWVLATYPKTTAEDLVGPAAASYQQLVSAGDGAAAEHLLQQAQLEGSLVGRLGKAVEPVFAPLGFDWKMSVGVMTSFAAREVIVSTLSVLYGMGADGAEDANSLTEHLRVANRADGSPVFTTATCLSLLVFYVLAMQCLPTQAVTRRETGSWRWPLVQLGSLSLLAYAAALVVYQGSCALGWG